MLGLRGWTLVAVAALCMGCVDERVVFRDRNLTDGVPAGAGGFVGYTNVTAKLTACGNCHVTHQNQWKQTAHAGAWATLANAAGRQALCEGCHTVSEQGNDSTSATAGWPGTQNDRFHDVQCENCHGAGFTHISNPDGGTIPLAHVNAARDGNGTCAECHSGVHHPFVEEWSESGHGTVIASPAGNPSCQGCHEGKAVLRAFGVVTRYAEENETAPMAITCAVCHDPHRARFSKQLRYAIDVPDEEQNLCMRCHHKRGGPEPTGNRGPHSPEGPMLLGEAGWWPPNMPIEPGTRIVTTHGSERNPRLCAGCHVQQYQITDAATGQLQMATTGHLFEAIPCVDANGRPTRQDNCAFDQRSFRACTNSGCHGSQAAARSAVITVRARIDNLNMQLKSQLTRVPASETNANDNRYTTAEGALFNSQLADRPGSVIHNPFLLEALLIATIQQIQREYGVSP